MIKLLFMDVDGTLTDGMVYISATTELFKGFCIKDGYAIRDILPNVGIVPIIITGRQSEIVSKRAEELGIKEVYQGCERKVEKMLEVASKYSIFPNEEGVLLGTAYIGDDIPDIECFQKAQISGCPADSAVEVKESANYVCSKNGGCGAVREFVEHLLNKDN